jgi:hypothetical protein
MSKIGINRKGTEVPSHAHQNGYDQKNLKMQMLVRTCGKRNSYSLQMKMQISAATMETSMEVLKP